MHDSKEQLTPGQLMGLYEKVKAIQWSCWRTNTVRRTRPTPEGEARNGMLVIEESQFEHLKGDEPLKGIKVYERRKRGSKKARNAAPYREIDLFRGVSEPFSGQETVWKAVPEHYRRLDRCLKRIGAEELPFDAPRKG